MTNPADPYAAPQSGFAAAAPLPTVAQLRSAHKLFKGFFVVGIVAYVVAGVLGVVAMPAEFSSRDPEVQQAIGKRMIEEPALLIRVMALGFLSLIASGLFITGVVFQMILHHRCWRVLVNDRPLTTPGKAVGFLFIPIYGFYWMFPSFMGLNKDLQRALAARGLNRPAIHPGTVWFLILIFLFQLSLSISSLIEPVLTIQIVALLLYIPIAILFVHLHGRTGLAAQAIAEHDAGREDRTP